jgi:hypothetical protein
MYMNTRTYIQRVNKEKTLTPREKRAFCGLPPKGKRKVSKEKQEEILKAASLKCPRLYNSVLYENNRVKVRLKQAPLKHITFIPKHLIRHFTPQEIRRAAKRLWYTKKYYNL